MATTAYTRDDITRLCDRLEARGQSLLLNDMPELQRDLRIAVTVLRKALDIGFPVRPIEV